MTLIYLALAWTVGIVLSSRTDPNPAVILLLSAFALGAMLINRRDHTARLAFAVLLFLGLGMLRFDAARPDTDSSHVMQLNDSGQLTLEGVIVAAPEIRDTGLQIVVDAKEAAGHTVHGRVLVRAPRYDDLAYGDEVRVFGFLRTPPEFDTFSYADYLARQKVFSVIYNADVEIIAHDKGNPLYAALLDVKDEARHFITRTLPEPQASLLVGTLLGDESGISEKVKADFSRTGTSHVIAISGFNMVILAQIIMLILRRFLSDGKAAIAGLVAITVYTILVGAGGAVVRAAVMSGLLIVGQALHRRTYVPTSIAFAVLLMSALDPWVLWDVGFQLSLAAVMGMALFVNPLDRFFNGVMRRIASQENAQRIMGILSESLVVTLAAQITTTPLILYYFGRLSIVSLAVNFLIIPAQTPLLLFGAVGTLTGLVLPAAGDIILQGAWVFLTWNVEVVQYFAGITWADHEVHLSQEAVVLFFAFLGVMMIYQATRPRWAMQFLQRSRIPARVVQAVGALVLVILVVTIVQRPDDRLHVSFMDSGQSVLIESPRGATILINGGHFPSRLLDNLGDKLPPRTRHLDILIVTTSDENSIAALPEIVDRYEIGAAGVNGQVSGTSEYTTLLESFEAAGVEAVPLSAGYTLTTDDGVQIDVIQPALTDDEDDSAADELVLRLTYGDAVFLLTGGIDAGVEARLLEHPHLMQATVLQIPNQGSGDSSSAPFVTVVNAQAAVLQSDPDESDPSPNVMQRFAGIPLFRTDQQGSIDMVSDGHTLWIHTAQ